MKNIRGKPYITVSAKGMINGLSNIPNDGADFGPDTTEGATAPGQYGSPYTETSGIQEALTNIQNTGFGGTIKLVSAVNYIINQPIIQDVSNLSITIEGNVTPINRLPDNDLPFITVSSSFPSGNYILTLTGNTGQFVYALEGIGFNGSASTNTSGLNILGASTGYEQFSTFYNLNIGKNYGFASTTQQMNGFTAIGNLYIDCATSIITKYEGYTEINPQFSFFSVYAQPICVIANNTGNAFGNITIVNPNIIINANGSVSPIVLQLLGVDQSTVEISNIWIWAENGVAGNTLTLLQTQLNTGSYPIHLVRFNGGQIYGTINTILADQDNPSGSSAFTEAQINGITISNSGTLQLVNGAVSNGQTRLTLRNSPVDTNRVTSIVSYSSTIVPVVYNSSGFPAPVTPSVPASGGIVTNENVTPVVVWILTGALTAASYISTYVNGGTNQNIGANPNGIRLNPGDQLYITYSTAPTWVFVPVQE